MKWRKNVWNQYGYQWDSLAIDCLIAITRNRFQMCAFLFFFCWTFYLVWWKRNVSRRHICSPVIPFTIHKTHWHTYGNNNIKRPQISRNEFFMLAVRQQHTARCDTHRLDKRIRTSFEHEHEHEHTQTERNNEREREKKSKWKTIHESVSALALLLPQLLLLLCVIVAVVGGFRTRSKHFHTEHTVSWIYRFHWDAQVHTHT